MKRIVTLSLLLFAASALSAQSESQKSLFTLDRLPWINPWLTTDNMSGMTLNDDIFKGFTAFSDATLSARLQSGSLKNIYDPRSTITGAFNIDSYSKLGKVFLYGRFGYDYSHMEESRWRGLIDPYETPFMMADSIPGNISLEMYKMEAGIGIPLGKFSIGVDVRYDVGLMAKHKDLRNKNTYMNFDISPGIMYRGETVKAGLNLGYIRNTEKIEYSQVDKNSEKYMFDLYGLWLYHSTGFSSAETSRMKENSSVYGAVQLDLIFGKFRIFNNFRAEYLSGLQGETKYNNLIHGETHKLTYSNSLTLQYGLRHRIVADFSSYRMTGDKFLQRQELDPASNVRIWVSYGGPVNCYVRNYRSEDISYTYRMAYSPTDISWEGTVGFRNYSTDHKYKEHPINFAQNLDIYEAYLRFAKYWVIKKSMIDFAPMLGYSFAGGDADRITNVESGEELPMDGNLQLLDQLWEEYNFWQAPKFSAGIHLRYGYMLNKEKGLNLNIKLNYNISGATGGVCKNTYRHYTGLSIGLTF